MSAVFNRRQFLKVSVSATGGLMVSLPFGTLAAKSNAAKNSPWIFVEVGIDGKVTIGARATEIGQGVKTSLPMLIAEELDVKWSAVNVMQLPYIAIKNKDNDKFSSKYGAQGAGGSTSIPGSFNELRNVGATARQLIIETAAKRWNADLDDLTTANGSVYHADGRMLAYGDLAAEAAKLSQPANAATLKTQEQFRIIGQPTRVVDTEQIVTGQALYGLDSTLPNAVVAVVERCPYFGGDVKSVDESEARKIPGVIDIIQLAAPDLDVGVTANMAAGVAVVASDTWSAIKGRRALKVAWKRGPHASDSTDKLEQRAIEALNFDGTVIRRDGDPTKRFDKGVRASYVMPFLAHSTLEPQNALVEIKHNHATVVASIQQPGRTSSLVSELTGIDRDNIDIEIPRSGGGFGRRLEVDYIAEAVLIAQKIKRPVKLVWTREDDIQNDYYRPFGVHQFEAQLDENNILRSWSHKTASTGKRYMQPGMASMQPWIACAEADQFPAGCVDNYQSSYTNLDFGLLCGWWRAPAPTFVAFPIQSFIDEVAHAANKDPLKFRLNLLGESRELDFRDHGGPTLHTGRLADVTQKVADEIGYGRILQKGRGIGIASYFVFGAYAAHAMEVSVEEGELTIHRCVCAVDVGLVVNPLGVEAQMMGGTIDGLSTALGLEITVKDGRIQQSNFPDYPHMRMAQAPDVEVHIVNTDYAPSGAGEMGIPTVAPALSNAIFAATGKRIRRLPIARQLAES